MDKKVLIKRIFSLIIFPLIILGLSISLQSLLAAWTSPTQNPPDGNVFAPINEGPVEQAKTGSFGVGGDFTVGVDKLYVDSTTGNIGINTTTPTLARLDLNGNAALENQSEIRMQELRINGNNYAGFKATSTMGGNIVWALPGADGTSGQFLKTTGGRALFWGGGITGNTGQIAYFSGTDTAVGTSSIYITTGQKVGIGTTTPNNKVDIYSTSKAAIGFSGASNSTNKWTLGMDVSNGGRFSIASSTALGTTDRLVIDGNGNVGIGTTNPAAKLDVNGNVYATPVMGKWYPTVDGPSSSAASPWRDIKLDGSSDVTYPAIFELNGTADGIKIKVAGYYHIEIVASVYLTAGDYGYVKILKDCVAGGLSEEGGFSATAATYESLYTGWKGQLPADATVSAGVFHFKDSAASYQSGPVRTRFTIERLN